MSADRSNNSAGTFDRWNESEGIGRLAPRECVRNAQGDLNKAWSTADYNEAVAWLRSGVDWLRRALEQMA